MLPPQYKAELLLKQSLHKTLSARARSEEYITAMNIVSSTERNNSFKFNSMLLFRSKFKAMFLEIVRVSLELQEKLAAKLRRHEARQRLRLEHAQNQARLKEQREIDRQNRQVSGINPVSDFYFLKKAEDTTHIFIAVLLMLEM